MRTLRPFLMVMLLLVAFVAIALPFLGLILAHFRPVALIEPPATSFSRLFQLFGKTLALAGLVGAASCALGGWFAWLDARSQFAHRNLRRILLLVPMAIPSYVLASILRQTFAPKGIVGSVLGVSDAFTGFLAASLVLTISCTPYAWLLISSAIQSCPQSEELVARTLGSTPWKVFKDVTWPRVRGAFVYAFLLVALYVVSDFGAVAILDCDVLTWELYKQRNGRNVFWLGLLLTFAVAPLIFAVQSWKLPRGRDSGGDTSMRTYISLKTSQKTFSWLVLGGYLLLGVGLPGLVLLKWLWLGVSSASNFVNLFSSISSTFTYGLVGAVAVCSVALCLALLIRKMPNRRALLELLVFLPSSLPGVLIAVGLLQVLMSLPFLNQDSSLLGVQATILFLIGAYVIRFLTVAYAALKPGVDSLNDDAELVARTLGASKLRIWFDIHRHQLSGALGAGLSLSFLNIAKELPITLTLVPFNQKTLAYRIYDAQTEGDLPDVALACVALLALVLIMTALTNFWRPRYD